VVDTDFPGLIYSPGEFGEQASPHIPKDEPKLRDVKDIAQGHKASQAKAGPRPGVHASPLELSPSPPPVLLA
jgi:hypothetical protein